MSLYSVLNPPNCYHIFVIYSSFPLTHNSQLTTHNSQLTTHHSPLTTHHSPLTTHNSQLTTHNSQLTTHQLTTHHSPLTTLQLTTHNSCFDLLTRIHVLQLSNRNSQLTKAKIIRFSRAGPPAPASKTTPQM